MITINKTKKGFTLLEMMLSIAIVTIISGCLVSLIVAIKDSYLSTYNSDDSADYAMLFAQGFENKFLAVVQEEGKFTEKQAVFDVQKKANSDGVLQDTLCMNGTPVFELKQMAVQRKGETARVAKWLIKMDFSWDSGTKMLNYTIYVIDNYYNPGHLKCVYPGGFALPHFDNGTITAVAANATTHDGGSITFKKK